MSLGTAVVIVRVTARNRGNAHKKQFFFLKKESQYKSVFRGTQNPETRIAYRHSRVGICSSDGDATVTAEVSAV
jgi:hypothetical protein